MFDLNPDWWQFPLRAGIVYFALFLMVRGSGKRTVGQFTPFDLLVVMLLSEAVSESLSGGDDSILSGLLVAVTLVALNATIGWVASRSRRLQTLLEGSPVLIGRDGRIYEQVLRRHRLARQDVEQSLREADCRLEDMRLAVLEADGQISIMKKGA